MSDDIQQFDPRYQTERVRFDSTELRPCEKCGRDNAPNRAKCVYCGSALEIKEASSAKLALRQLEPWEKGWNVVATTFAPNIDAAAVARLVGLDGERLSDIFRCEIALPIARTETSDESSILSKQLIQAGISNVVVSDESLDPDIQPTRLSGLEFGEGHLSVRDFNTASVTAIPGEEFALIVVGELMTEKTDLLEKKRRRGQSKVLDEMQTSADETVIDLYSRTDPKGYRINLAGFDFSCLGDAMGMYAAENIRSLVTELHDRFPSVRVVTDYARVRHLLDPVWEVESRKDSRGLQRAGFGKVEFGSTSSTSNLRQFTKYSRLQWHLL